MIDEQRSQCDSLKQKLIETGEMLDNREHMLMMKADEIMEMQRAVAEAHEREMKNLNMYETQRIVTEQVQAHLDEAQDRIQNRDRLINLKEEDIADMKATVEQAIEREHNMQSALEEQRQVSNLLRD